VILTIIFASNKKLQLSFYVNSYSFCIHGRIVAFPDGDDLAVTEPFPHLLFLDLEEVGQVLQALVFRRNVARF